MIPNQIVSADGLLRITASGTTVGVAQTKGTATDLLLVVTGTADGANAVAGSTALAVQGSNVTASASSNWTNVTPDKGTLAAVTVATTQVVHLAQLQYQYYRLQAVAATTATADLVDTFVFFNVQDSVSNTQN